MSKREDAMMNSKPTLDDLIITDPVELADFERERAESSRRLAESEKKRRERAAQSGRMRRAEQVLSAHGLSIGEFGKETALITDKAGMRRLADTLSRVLTLEEAARDVIRAMEALAPNWRRRQYQSGLCGLVDSMALIQLTHQRLLIEAAP